MDARFLDEMGRVMTDQDLIRATLAIDPADQERRHKAEAYIRELGRRDIRKAMWLYRAWKKEERP